MGLPKSFEAVGTSSNIANKGGITQVWAVPFEHVASQPKLKPWTATDATTTEDLLSMLSGNITLFPDTNWTKFDFDIESGKCEAPYEGDRGSKVATATLSLRINSAFEKKVSAMRALFQNRNLLIVFREPDQNYGGEVGATYSPWRVIGDVNQGLYVRIDTNNASTGDGIKGKNMVELSFVAVGLEPYIFNPTGGVFPPAP